MRLLLLHLSDLHISDPADPLLRRTELILASLRGLDPEISHAVLIVSGDVTYAGKDSQYLIAAEFFRAIVSQLPRYLSPSPDAPPLTISLIATPGNHDCDFSSISEETRSVLVTPLATHPELCADHSYADLCLSVQRSFFTFLDSLESPSRRPAHNDSHPNLVYQYVLPGTPQITINCYNTAWVSQRHEQPGQLYFPPAAIRPHPPDAELVLSVLHHPLNWLHPACSRAVRDALFAGSDFVLTGHEHASSRFSHGTEIGDTTTCIEASALQDPESASASAFTALVVDTSTRQYRITHHVWNGEIYVARAGLYESAPDGLSSWEPFPAAPRRHSGRFSLSEGQTGKLDDLGLLATHRRRGVLHLSDVFVYPDLREVPYVPDRPASILKGEHTLLAFKEHHYILITGASQSGKTSLAKSLFRDLHAGGDIPLLLDGPRRLPTGDLLATYLNRQFEYQYSPQALEHYRQLDASRRIIIVDDFHKHRYTPAALRDLLQSLTRWAGRVILVADELNLGVRELANPTAATTFKHYHILPFGHVRRNILVERWLLLDRDSAEDPAVFVRQLTNVQRTLETLIGRNFVPAYPAYILAILQAAEAATPIDTSASTHGYFYELLIKTMLAKSMSREDYDIIMAYLGFLAYRMFSAHTDVIDRLQFQRAHDEYCTRYDVRRKSERMLDLLVRSRVLTLRDAGYGFTYRYIYYYFVAAHLRDHIGEESIRENIHQMARSLYKEVSANVLLFLAHVSKDPFIVAELLGASREIISGLQPFAFGADAEFFRGLSTSTPALTYREGTGDSRKEMLESLDDVEAAPDGAPGLELEVDLPPEALSDPLVQLTMAFKALQIVGQVVKNFPGSLEAATKSELVTECCGLGLRSLSLVYKLLRENQDTLLGFLAEVQKRAHPRLRHDEANRKAGELLAVQTRIVGFGVIKAISSAIGSRELGPTYDRVFAQGESPALSLVRCSVDLDHGATVPEAKILSLVELLSANRPASDILRMLMLHHFYLFEVDYQTKQRMCQSLGIPYVALRAVDPAQRLLAPG